MSSALRLLLSSVAGCAILFLWTTRSPAVQHADFSLRRRAATVLHQQRRWSSPKPLLATTGPATVANMASGACPASRKAYHVLLTASTGIYQQWQSRIFYYHYVQLKVRFPCSDLGGFTRLLTTPGAQPDDIMHELPTILVKELTAAETLGFVVLNRPHSVLTALKRGDLTKLPEPYLLIAETDHLLLNPMPNTATPAEAVGYPFHYMMPRRNTRTIDIVRRFAGSDAAARAVQQVGPSPILIHLDALTRLVQLWYDLSFALKKDPAADAEFGWMLEMWGYSIAAGVAGIPHQLPEHFQLEPSQQFGTVITTTNDGNLSHATHHIMHYTFGHEYSLEGVPTIDSKTGAWGLDKRQYQKGLPRHLVQPPHCALESTQVLWRLFHEAMAAHDRNAAGEGGKSTCAGCTGSGASWPHGSPDQLTLLRHDKAVRAAVEKLPSIAADALALIGTGPWRWADATTPDAKADAPFYFLRGGQLETPWGSAAWGASVGVLDAADAHGDPIVLFLCGRDKWTHSLRITRTADGTARELTVTARGSGEVSLGALDETATRPPAPWLEADGTPTRHGVGPGTSTTPPASTTTSPKDELVAALLGQEDRVLDRTPQQVRARLLGTGPYRFHGTATLHFLAHGLAYVEAPGGGVLGRWRALVDPVEGASVLLQYPPKGRDRVKVLTIRVRCWHLEVVPSADQPAASADLVWSRPASRCFPTCSDVTHPLTAREATSSRLAQRVIRAGAASAPWTWAGIPGLRFTFSEAEQSGLLITPWGHGSWGIVPSRGDVLVAEFAQKRHMLKFETNDEAFVSTRCDDGELVRGRLA